MFTRLYLTGHRESKHRSLDCSCRVNRVAAVRNRQLTDKLANGIVGVLLLDLSKINYSRPDANMTNIFPNKLVSCCISDDDKGYWSDDDKENNKGNFSAIRRQEELLSHQTAEAERPDVIPSGRAPQPKNLDHARDHNTNASCFTSGWGVDKFFIKIIRDLISPCYCSFFFCLRKM